MAALNGLIPADCVRISFELGDKWFVADLPTELLWGALDSFTEELSAAAEEAGELSHAEGFAKAGELASARVLKAARHRDALSVCLAGLWIVLYRPPDAQAARAFLVETVDQDGRAWIGISADQDASTNSVVFDIAPAHLAEPDTDLDDIEIVPAKRPVH
jgi:hypothetical protein